jgi:hypothetical protein
MCEPKIAFGPAMPVRPKSGESAVWPPCGDNQRSLHGMTCDFFRPGQPFVEEAISRAGLTRSDYH